MRRSKPTRRERSWAQVEKVVGRGLSQLPAFFKNGLYALIRAGLPDAEILRAYQRCRAWHWKSKKDGYGQCECPCGTRCAVNAVNAQGVSVWNLDHCKYTKTFRGILFARCNVEIGDGNRKRKSAHLSYVESHETRLRIDNSEFVCRNEFQAVGAIE
jgi:hypothetical protein